MRQFSVAFLIVLMAPLAAWFAAHVDITLPLRSLRQLLVFLVLAPGLEEWVFRYHFQEELTTWLGRPHLAHLLTALIFMALHWQAQGALLLLWLIPGLALGEIWRRHRSLALNFAVHAWFNLCLWYQA